ncbi:MAG: chloride channel protein [Myxococcales bacterium]|nr:chloride channel protein [Myxococcales bacterium]
MPTFSEMVPAAPRTRLARVFHDTLSGYLRELSPHSRRFWVLVPLTGLVAGVGAVAAVEFMNFVQTIAWHGKGSLLDVTQAAAWWRRLLVPILAGVIIILAGFVVHQKSEGHGTSEILESIWVRSGRVRLRSALTGGFLTLVAVAMGASVGREGALIYFGAASASWIGRRANVDADQLKLLVACGTSAGIAAAYNTPIGGALFGLEVFLGGLALELYGPIIFATVTATLVSRTLMQDHPSYVIPPYKLEHASELPLYLLLGAIVGVVSAVFVRTVETTARWSQTVPARVRRLLPVAALALVGVGGIAYPQLFGNGYDTVNQALVGTLPLGLILALPLLKMVLSALCASFGVPGGLFTPSLFVGALTGAAFGAGAHYLFPNLVPSPGGYVLVGMAAILAGSTHATMAAALMLFEMTGSYGVILPLLAACVVSAVVSRAITSESIYTAPLKRKGVVLPRITRPAWMQRTGVASLVRADAPKVAPSTRLEDVVLHMSMLPEGDDLFVVSDGGELLGVISLDSLREVLADLPDLGLVVAADVMERAGAVSVDASLWEATRRALAAESTRLPVVSPRDNNRFLGTLAIPDVLAAARRSDTNS